MKTLHLSIIVGISFLSFVFLMIPQNVYAYTCAVDAPPLTPRYYYLHSDSVFVGTVSSISNYTAHQWNVKFNVEKSWKGNQHPTITTYSLVACGYSFVEGEKYLVFANGSPPDYDPLATKPFVNAQNEIALLDSSQFQTQESANEILYKKLVNARDALSNMMGSRMSKIPISSAGVNDLNFTLDVGIADKKASLPSGAQAYKQKLEEIVGNVPIRILYAEYATALPEILTQHGILSPLKQLKSGIAANDVKCEQGLQLVIRAEDGSPACVKPDTATKLELRGWAAVPTTATKYIVPESFMPLQTSNLTNETVYHDFPHPPEYSLVDTTQGIEVPNDAEASKLTSFDVKSPTYLPQGYQVKLIKAAKEIPLVTIFASKFPLTKQTTSGDFLWNQKGILITYEKVNDFELQNYKQVWSNYGNQILSINGANVTVFNISKKYHEGYLYDDWASLIAIKGDVKIVVRGFFNSNDMIKMATSMLEK